MPEPKLRMSGSSDSYNRALRREAERARASWLAIPDVDAEQVRRAVEEWRRQSRQPVQNLMDSSISRVSAEERAAVSRLLLDTDTLPSAAQAEVVRALRQEASALRNLNREEEAIFWDGEPYMRGVYDRDNPRRANGRYRTRNGEPLPSEYDRRREMIMQAMRSRLRNIARRYNLL